MYGYVRPFKPEMKIKDFERYKSAYCGLCHALRDNYGHLARLAVSYDMTLLVMALSGGEPAARCMRRCGSSPFKKKCVAARSPALDTAAGLTVILAWYKLCDEVRDGGFFKALGARFARLFLRPKYKKARKRFPDFDALAKENLGRLSECEARGEPSLDAAADCFASVTGGFGACADGDVARRILRELFYHVGRAVYILDAADDYEEDFEKNRYNPVRARYAPDTAELPDGVKERIRETLEQSLASAAAALELLPEGEYTPAMENILCLGMPAVITEVLSGERRKRDGRTI